ncbi:MAG TPA: uridine kinase [Verrucomicrobiae bacterium]|jgi:uridine kinase
MNSRPKLVALAGGSGAGKTWLAARLREILGCPATHLSLDDFYHDQSHLARSERERVNYDHPRAIDWRLAQAVLQSFRDGESVLMPQYSFKTHTRKRTFKTVRPRPVILVDGLWPWWRPGLRRLFDVRVFVDCPERLRLERRLERDMAARGRDGGSVRRQFEETVAPMHERFVAPQAEWADVVLRHPVGRGEVERVAAMIEGKARA